jgi:hypothetical protein
MVGSVGVPAIPKRNDNKRPENGLSIPADSLLTLQLIGRRPFVGIPISNLGRYLRRIGLDQHLGWDAQTRMQPPDHL